MMRSALALGFGALVVAMLATAGPEVVSAQGGGSTADGIFSDAQAARGMSLAVAECGACHGAMLTGGDFAPAISGAEFFGRWEGETLSTLVTKVTETMPLSAPGSLAPAQYSDIVAYILQASGYPTGDGEFDVAAAANESVVISPAP